MAATSKTKRTAGAKATKKKASRTSASKTKRSRNSTSTTSAKKSRSRAATKKGASKTAAKRTARKAPARKRATRTTPAKTSAKKRASGITATNTTKEDRQFLRRAEGLDRSTERAKWIHSPDEHEDHPGQTLATRSHDVIQHWAEERNAKPATVPGTEHGDRAGVLRLDFPGYGGGNLQQISWDEWFAPFDARELVFVFQQHTSDGSQSNFFHLDNPNRGQA